MIALISIAVAVSGAMFVNDGLLWLDMLKKPSFMPPNWVFAVVWNLIYLSTACAATILVRAYKHTEVYRWLLFLFFIFALLIPLWTYLFFVHHSLGGALIDMIVMEFTVLTIIFYTYQDAFSITLLMLPAAGWLGFALYLYYQILMLNF